MRRAAKKDANHNKIVCAIEKFGAKVLDLSGLGNGAPDILVGYRGRLYLMEIKDGEKPPSEQKLRRKQEEFHVVWSGYVWKVKSTDEALSILKIGCEM